MKLGFVYIFLRLRGLTLFNIDVNNTKSGFRFYRSERTRVNLSDVQKS